MGKIRNVAWGYFEQLASNMVVTGSCRFSLQQLLPILNFQKENNYLYVASGTENKIDRIVLDYIGMEAKTQLNRVDMMGTALNDINVRLINLGLNLEQSSSYLKYSIDLTRVFLDTIEKNADLVTKMADLTCQNSNSCSRSFYERSCQAYFHGSEYYLDPNDNRYNEEFMLLWIKYIFKT